MQKSPNKLNVLCDACHTNEKQMAVKSCLQCVTSFCETHLESHKRAARLMKHKLIDPVENLEDYICGKHENPLELFCRDDQTFLCRFCTEIGHENHNTVPIEQESEDRRLRNAQLKTTQAEVKMMIQDRMKKAEEIKSSIKTNKNKSVKILAALNHCIERCQDELLRVMEQKQKAAEWQAEELIKDLEKEMSELKRRDTELEQLSHTEDHLHLLRTCSSACSPPQVKIWTSNNTEMITDLNTETLETALQSLQENLKMELMKFLECTMKKKDASVTSSVQQDTLTEASNTATNTVQTEDEIYLNKSSTLSPNNMEKLDKHSVKTDLSTIKKLYAVDVILDPKTAYLKLNVSKDGKQVQHSGSWTDVPNDPERFDSSACVLAKDGFSCGKFYYEVKVGDKTEWDLGMARESIKRKGKIRVSPENGFWCIWLRNRSEYVANESSPVSLAMKDKPQNVGVFVDYEEGLVSFYNVETKALIYSFTAQTFTEKIYPYFSPCNKKRDVNKKPLIVATYT